MKYLAVAEGSLLVEGLENGTVMGVYMVEVPCKFDISANGVGDFLSNNIREASDWSQIYSVEEQ